MSGASGTFVVDASAGVQIYVAEPLSVLANSFYLDVSRAAGKFATSDLFFAECSNILWKKFQRGVVSSSEAKSAMLNLLKLPLLVTPCEFLAVDALELAMQQSISAYDACYAALAHREKCPLITADQKLIAKLSGSGIAVEWLGNWSPTSSTTPSP